LPFPDIMGASNALVFMIETDFLRSRLGEQKPRHRTGSICLQKKAACGIAVTNIARY